MKIHLYLDIEEEKTPQQIEKYTEIFNDLLKTGALDGLKGGSANIHFDHNSMFQGIQLDYWPWRRRKKVD